MDKNQTNPATTGGFCSACGTSLNAGARFCHRCGKAAKEEGKRNAQEPVVTRSSLPWGVAALALVALVALVAAQKMGWSPGESAGPMSTPLSAGGMPDLASMSAEERAERLFDRVMRYTSAGMDDSAAFFAPMAISAIEAIPAPLTAHNRFDIGLIGLASANPALAAAQADSILRERPTHLLGLVLGIRAAVARNDAAVRAAFEKRLVAAEAAELAVDLQEYTDHRRDIDEALSTIRR